jgi:hypothetical protein
MRGCKFAVVAVVFALGSCATDYAHAPLTERSYQAAAKHCHSDSVLRLTRGKPQLVYVSGLMNERTAAPYIANIDCVREFLGVARDDVIIIR